MAIIEAVWKPDEVEEAAAAPPVEVEGVKAVLAEEKEGVKVLPAAGETIEASPAEATSAEKERPEAEEVKIAES